MLCYPLVNTRGFFLTELTNLNKMTPYDLMQILNAVDVIKQ